MMTRASVNNTAPSHAGKPSWQPVAGFTWELFFIGLAWVVAFGSLIAIVLWMTHGNSPSSIFWLGFWVYFALIYKFTAWLSNKYRTRQKRRLVTAQALLASDPRLPVLYLRCFKDDERTSRLLNLSTEEQELAVTMLEIGPFITFGEQGEEFPDPGAARMYVDHEHWQDKIADLMAKAQLVVGRIANTDSFWWEMETAKQILSPEKLVLLLPEHEHEYQKFRLRAKTVFPHELPDHRFQSRKSALSKSHISSQGLLYFAPDWMPHVRPLPPATLRQTYWMPGVPIFKLALEPVYAQLGVEWKRPPLQPLMILAVILLTLGGLFTIYVGALQVAKLVELFRRYF
jgi:hypothetical protein